MFKHLVLAAALLIPLPAMAAELGDDGLHDAPWIEETFMDLREDLEDAASQGRRLAVIIEQRGCIYCDKMHEEVFVVPEIEQMLAEDFYVVQINMFGDIEVTDFDGEAMSEKDMVRRWNMLFTPTILFFPPDVPEDVTAAEAAAATIPGAFGRWTTQNMMTWVLEEGYQGDESFQRYHARKFAEQSQ